MALTEVATEHFLNGLFWRQQNGNKHSTRLKEINIYSLKFPLRCEGEGSSISMFGERMEGNTHSMFFFFFFHIGKIVDYSISLKCISNLDSQAKNRKSMYYELDAKKKNLTCYDQIA